MRFRRAPGGQALGSVCADVELDGGERSTFRAAMYKVPT